MFSAKRLYSGLNVLLCFLVLSSSARAGDAPWTTEVVSHLLRLQLNSSCFDKPAFDRHVHILGVTSDAKLLDATQQAMIIDSLTSTISESTRNRVTNARTFQFIASQNISTSEVTVRRMMSLEKSANNADITVLLRPLASEGRSIRTSVMMWANNNRDGASNLSCTPTFPVLIEVLEENPRCEKYWNLIKQSNDADELRAYAKFNQECSQASEALALAAKLEVVQRNQAKSSRCRLQYTNARVENSIAALKRFAKKHADCSQVGLALEYIRIKEETERERNRIAANERRQREARDEEARREREEAARAEGERLRRRAKIETKRRQRRETNRTKRTCYVHDVRPPDDWLSLRTQPSGSRGQRLAKLRRGTPIEVLGPQSANWHKVRAWGQVGWVSWQKRRWIRC